VYGVGALLVIFLLRPFTQNLLVLFVFGVLVTSVLEYITGFLLEKLFHTTWWDYSKRKFNIKGRVCLRNSLLFGILSVLLLHFINPFVEKLEAWIPEWALPAIAFVFLFYFITDSVITVRSILAMNGKLDELEKAANMDPELPLPVETYRELCILDDRGFGLPEDVPELEEEFSPGYHKGEVTQAFDTLRFPLPGVYRYEWNEDGRGGGGCIWWDEESDSPLWRVSGYRSKNVKAAWNADLTDFSDVETREEPGFSAHWGWKELEQRTDPEKPMYQVLGEVAAGPTLFVFTVTFSLPEERENIYARIRRIEAVEREEA